MPDLKAVAERLLKALGLTAHQAFVGVSHSYDRAALAVYVIDRKCWKHEWPLSEWEGYPVKFKYLGKIVVQD